MNFIIIILSVLLMLSILYILYIKLYSNKKVRFNNKIQQKEYNKYKEKEEDNNYKNDYNMDEMSFLEPDYETKRLEELKFDMI